MTDRHAPGEIPADLPPEYAEAYRRGYENALRRDDGAGTSGDEPTVALGGLTGLRAEPAPQSQLEPAPDAAAWSADPGREPEPGEDPDADFRADEAGPRWRRGSSADRPGWFVPAILAGLAVVLLLSAYGLGRVFSSQVGDSAPAAADPTGLVMNEDGSTPSGADGSAVPSDSGNPVGKRYDGAVQPAAIGGAQAACQAADGVDAAGHKVSYAPSEVFDGDQTTAWRCDGSGVGERMVLTLPGRTSLGEVGLVPGYAKTDPSSGADRYAENNRITKVRWVFPDGSAYVQDLDGSAGRRDLQTMRIPVTKADRVTIEILATTRGPRNTTAISEVRLGATS